VISPPAANGLQPFGIPLPPLAKTLFEWGPAVDRATPGKSLTMQEAPKPLWFGASCIFINRHGKRLAPAGDALFYGNTEKGLRFAS
jgi:hypothetical protein